MASKSAKVTGGRRRGATDHESFLRHAGFQWAKVAGVLCGIALLGFLCASVPAGPYGATWYGYGLGTIGLGLIVWLSLLGIRKRAMTPGRWPLKAWTSAHVYLGLALVVVATLHTGLRFGWNLHTLAYALMILVILSGVFGVVVYAMLPSALSANREEQTQAQMIDGVRAIDRQLQEAAQPLPPHLAQMVLAAMEDDAFAPGLWARMRSEAGLGATEAAISAIQSEGGASEALDRVEKLLNRRKSALDRLKRQLRLRALLEVWLYVHIPATVALLAALTAHVVSEFYYW